MNARELRNKGWRSYADLRRVITRTGSSTSALESLGDPPRTDLAAWNETTEARHDGYRAAHPIVEGRVAVVCVSMRPQLIDDVVANVGRQDGVDTELVFVANSPDFDHDVVDAAFEPLGAVIERPPPDTSLGVALNRAMARTDARFVAKFDDDDIYGANYLADALRAHAYAGAGVVGKHSYFARIAETGATHIRFPGNEFRYSGTLAGGTFVIDRDRVGGQQFDDISLGEDRAFLSRCHRRGISTFSADRFNFVQMRTGSNTWAIDDAAYLKRSIEVDDSAVIDR
ncbi:glycosyltransferase [Ilumatobacter sp.]|uniref:glycosyltransferase n=1 Tax=Ilumatobacter sp. TaxID=1967498 RepID=UPI003C43D6E3